MAEELRGRRVAMLATDGVEQIEVEQPRRAVRDAGGQVELLATHSGEIQAMNADINRGDALAVDGEIAHASPDDYDALLLPGGTVNPDTLRGEPSAVEFVRTFVRSGKPVGAICHGPWTLVEADVVRGRTVTSVATIRTDIRNAGGTVVDREVVTDEGLVTSRGPDDLGAFNAKIVEEFAEGKHPART